MDPPTPPDFLPSALLAVEKLRLSVWGIFFIFGDLPRVRCDDVSDSRRWSHWTLFPSRSSPESGSGSVSKLFVLIIIIVLNRSNYVYGIMNATRGVLVHEEKVKYVRLQTLP